MRAQRVPQPPRRELPVRLRVADQLGQRTPARRPWWTLEQPASRRLRRTCRVPSTDRAHAMRPRAAAGRRRSRGRGCTAGHSRATNARSRRTSQWCQTADRDVGALVASRRPSSTTRRRRLHRPRPVVALVASDPVAGAAGGRRPGPASSAIAHSTWFHASVWPPGDHGTRRRAPASRRSRRPSGRPPGRRSHARHCHGSPCRQRSVRDRLAQVERPRSCRSADRAALGQPGRAGAAS